MNVYLFVYLFGGFNLKFAYNKDMKFFGVMFIQQNDHLC